MLNHLLQKSIREAIFTFFDTETTGDNQKRVDKPIEIAAVHWNYEKGFLGAPKSWLVNPEMPIHPAAIAVHGLMDEDVENAPLLEEVLPELHEYCENTILVAHNIEFDLNMLPTLRTTKEPKVDSLRFVRQIFKIGEPGYKQQELTSHKMQELRYWLNCKVDTMGLQAHRAAADILVTGEVFSETMRRFLDRSYSETIEDMIQFIESPIMIEKMHFGKYKNVKISDAIKKEINKPKNYFSWLLKSVHNGNMQIDDDLKYSIEYHLKQYGIDPKGFLLEDKQKNWQGVIESIRHKDTKDLKAEVDKVISPSSDTNVNITPKTTSSENELGTINLAIQMLSKKKTKKTL